MRAMVLEEFGGPLTLQTRAVPEPSSSDMICSSTRAEIAHSLQLVRDSSVKTIIGASFPLAQAEYALEAIRRKRVFGQVLVDCVR